LAGNQTEEGSEIGKFIMSIFGRETKPKKEVRSEILSSQFLAGSQNQKRKRDRKIYHLGFLGGTHNITNFWWGTKTEEGSEIGKIIIVMCRKDNI
jgi:hypothetical protein